MGSQVRSARLARRVRPRDDEKIFHERRLPSDHMVHQGQDRFGPLERCEKGEDDLPDCVSGILRNPPAASLVREIPLPPIETRRQVTDLRPYDMAGEGALAMKDRLRLPLTPDL